MDTYQFDLALMGAGIAGSTAATALAPHRHAALIEAEEPSGYPQEPTIVVSRFASFRPRGV